jgi:hypothetical protein
MENEERNRVMDNIWNKEPKALEYDAWRKEQVEAIRECDRKARAWDGLEETMLSLRVIYQKGDTPDEIIRMTLQRALHKMAELLAPRPKNPLEELLKSLKAIKQRPNEDPAWVYISEVEIEIRRLRGVE